MGQQPTICLFVEHMCPDMSHSLYLIKPPVDMPEDGHLIDSEGFMADSKSKSISPVVTFKEENNFLPLCATANLGSKIYFFGGRFEPLPHQVQVQVQVFDTDHPDQGMHFVAPMNAPKTTPCVFVADGMIYTLSSILDRNLDSLPNPLSKAATGVFERYHPCSNRWQVLPDPPIPNFRWGRANFLDRATVVGRQVFIGSSISLIFNLDTLEWDPLLPSELPGDSALSFRRFPSGSFFVPDSFYNPVSGPAACKLGTEHFRGARVDEPLKIVKRGPVTTTTTTTKDRTLRHDPCLDPGKEQIMAQGIDLDENKPFTKFDYYPWRDLFHMGGRFFCYVVTAQLVDWLDAPTDGEPNSRAVLIKFFEEVPAHTDNNIYNKTKFRPLASFCYKIITNFFNPSFYIRCSVLGTVPECKCLLFLLLNFRLS